MIRNLAKGLGISTQDLDTDKWTDEPTVRVWVSYEKVLGNGSRLILDVILFS
jgi:hypothetical protein